MDAYYLQSTVLEDLYLFINFYKVPVRLLI